MGFVYLIQQGADSCFKIGSSENGVVERLKGLQTGNPVKLRIFGTIEAPEYEKLENDLHNEFRAFKEEGEWFLIDPATVVKILNRHDGKICVDDPYKFAVKQAKQQLDVDAMCKLIKDDVAATTYKWFETQLGNFIDRLNIASDMARVLAVRRAMRIKKLGAFLLSGLSLFVVASSICFFLFFYVEADREPFSSKIKTAAYWDFSTHNLTGFLVWEAVITAVACIAGVIASKEVKQPTDVEIDWHEYIITKKALLKKK